MATQLTRHFTCRIRVLAAIFALIALYFAFREPSLKRARDQPDEQPNPLPLYTHTHTHAAQAWLQGGCKGVGGGGCYPCAAASFGFTEFTLLGSDSLLERAFGTMCPGTVPGNPGQYHAVLAKSLCPCLSLCPSICPVLLGVACCVLLLCALCLLRLCSTHISLATCHGLGSYVSLLPPPSYFSPCSL